MPTNWYSRKRKLSSIMSGSSRSEAPKKKPRYVQQQALSLKPTALKSVQRATLRYCTRFQMDAGSGGVPAVRVFHANGVYDPDWNIGGHQPRGWDQLIALYDHAVVRYAKIKVYADNNAENSGMYVGVALLDTQSTAIDFRDYMEYGLKKGVLLSDTTGAPSAKTFQFGADPTKFLGRSSALSDPDLKNSDGANAAELASWHIFAYPLNEGDAQPVNIMIELEYEVDFIEPKRAPLS